MKKNELAFPFVEDKGGISQEIHKGMTLRDYFAAKAMQGLVVGCSGMLGNEFSAYAKGSCNSVIAERAYLLADVMLKERVKGVE